MKTVYTFWVIIIISLSACINRNERKYQVSIKDSANISIFISMLYPKENLVFKVNGIVLLDEMGADSTGNPTKYLYFKYPDTIRTIDIGSYYYGDTIFQKKIRDTLLDVKKRSVLISRPFPKGMTDKTYRNYGYVPIYESQRKVTLVDDYEYYKGTFTY